MMPLIRRASLVVVLLLLASIGTAFAECAWVLWKTQRVSLRLKGSTSVEPFEPFETRAECVRAMADVPASPRGVTTLRAAVAIAATDAGMGRDTSLLDAPVQISGNSVVLLDPTAEPKNVWPLASAVFECWPSTVDLRGPKAK
jgi:hypothetical protein